ncbi:hypothetical protein K440DRAFT_130014 [Wilcoxina mikolae CBS 423.85]|nr:hypothetical protein K440DRAFT_130014 [Wilcoxina mikolae CBS 423.85]
MSDNSTYTYVECDSWGNCYSSRWNTWGRWIFISFLIIGFIFFIAMLIARRRRRSGMRPIVGTGWLAPKNQHPTHHTMPGPPGPAGYYPPPPPPGQEAYGHYGNFYTPPPYTPNPQYTGTTTNSTSTNAYYAPPPGPPPAHPIGQSYELAPHGTSNGVGTPYRGPGSPAPLVSSHPTGTSTHSYVQSNNPFQPPASPPPAHVTDIHTGKN